MLLVCVCGWRGESIGGMRRHKRTCTVDDPNQRERDDRARLERVRDAARVNDQAHHDEDPWPNGK